MNIDEALKKFKSNSSRKYSHTDIDLIKTVVSELGVVDFRIYSTSRKLNIYIRDRDDSVHIHPTMIVSQVNCRGAEFPSKYVGHPYLVKLERWTRG